MPIAGAHAHWQFGVQADMRAHLLIMVCRWSAAVTMTAPYAGRFISAPWFTKLLRTCPPMMQSWRALRALLARLVSPPLTMYRDTQTAYSIHVLTQAPLQSSRTGPLCLCAWLAAQAVHLCVLACTALCTRQSMPPWMASGGVR